MKLKEDFFQIITTTVLDNGFTTTVRLNPDHIIYKGHFPGHPITPGVILLQIVHELLEGQMGNKLKLETIPNCKFLHVLDPGIDPLFKLEFSYQKSGNSVLVSTIGKSGVNTIIKMESVYVIG